MCNNYNSFITETKIFVGTNKSIKNVTAMFLMNTEKSYCLMEAILRIKIFKSIHDSL